MAMIRRPDDDLFHQMDRMFGPQLFERLFGPSMARLGDREGLTLADWAPAVDVSEDEQAYHIHADLPAVRKEDIEITCAEGMLTIKGERRSEREEKDEERRFHRVERSWGRFQRSFSVPDDVDPAAIRAAHRDGVLELTLPKTRKQPNGKRAIKVE